MLKASRGGGDGLVCSPPTPRHPTVSEPVQIGKGGGVGFPRNGGVFRCKDQESPVVPVRLRPARSWLSYAGVVG